MITVITASVSTIQVSGDGNIWFTVWFRPPGANIPASNQHTDPVRELCLIGMTCRQCYDTNNTNTMKPETLPAWHIRQTVTVGAVHTSIVPPAINFSAGCWGSTWNHSYTYTQIHGRYNWLTASFIPTCMTDFHNELTRSIIMKKQTQKFNEFLRLSQEGILGSTEIAGTSTLYNWRKRLRTETHPLQQRSQYHNSRWSTEIESGIFGT